MYLSCQIPWDVRFNRKNFYNSSRYFYENEILVVDIMMYNFIICFFGGGGGGGGGGVGAGEASPCPSIG